jgi:hypothetical protein
MDLLEGIMGVEREVCLCARLNCLDVSPPKKDPELLGER